LWWRILAILRKTFSKRNIPSKFPFSKDPKKKTKIARKKKRIFFWTEIFTTIYNMKGYLRFS
jgi:hypothetical protein